jgi:hypothetical protein
MGKNMQNSTLVRHRPYWGRSPPKEGFQFVSDFEEVQIATV